jgi:hypothetical protein
LRDRHEPAKINDVDEVVRAAARNNAEWCRAMCAAHRIESSFAEDTWTSPRRTPRYYPDAVTLTPEASAVETLAAVDDSPGCSIKDSFALLDLSGHGFVTLRQARWIHRPPGRSTDPVSSQEQWSEVRTAAELAAWQREWSGEPDPPELFVPALLSDPAVSIVAGRSGRRLIGGAVLYRGSNGIGVSNVFDRRADTPQTWNAVLALAAHRFNDPHIYGYESADGLPAAQAAGFAIAGELRIWWRRV